MRHVLHGHEPELIPYEHDAGCRQEKSKHGVMELIGALAEGTSWPEAPAAARGAGSDASSNLAGAAGAVHSLRRAALEADAARCVQRAAGRWRARRAAMFFRELLGGKLVRRARAPCLPRIRDIDFFRLVECVGIEAVWALLVDIAADRAWWGSCGCMLDGTGAAPCTHCVDGGKSWAGLLLAELHLQHRTGETQHRTGKPRDANVAKGLWVPQGDVVAQFLQLAVGNWRFERGGEREMLMY